MMKMFVTDLDGTVLMQGETQVKKDLLEMVTELYQSKKDFVVASGRSYGALKRFFPSHFLSMYFICENGALIQYQGKTLYKKALLKKEVLSVVEQIEKCGCEWVAAGVHTIYTGNHCTKVSEFYREIKMPIMKVLSAREIPEDVIRISVWHENATERDAVIKVIDGFSTSVKISYQDGTWTDILDKMTDKGTALQTLMGLKKIDANDVAVYGDNTNDIEMFEVTANSYAMSWASDVVKKSAQKETSCVMKSIREAI